MGIAADIIRAEADLLRAADDLLAVNDARQKPIRLQIIDVSIMQRGYEAQRDRRDVLERELWRLQALQAARQMESNNAA